MGDYVLFLIEWRLLVLIQLLLSKDKEFNISMSNLHHSENLARESVCTNATQLNRDSNLKLRTYDPKSRAREKAEEEYLNEVWGVQQVPCTIENVSKPSVVVDKLLLMKKADQDVALRNFQNEFHCIHKNCDKEIEKLKKSTEVEIDEIHINIENRKRDLCEMRGITPEDYEEFKGVIETMVKKERTMIEDLYERMKIVDSKRQSSATQIFIKYNKILKQLYYLSTNELKILMESKIMEYNQLALSNHKKYEDVKLKLLLSSDVYKQKFYTWFKEMKKNRGAVVRKKALDNFYLEHENFKNAGAMYLGTIEGKSAVCRLKSRKNVIPATVAEWDLTVPYAASRFDEQTYLLDNSISAVVSTVTDFIQSYKSYTFKCLNKMLNALKKIRVVIEMYETLSEDGEEEQEPDYEDYCACQNTYEKAKEQCGSFVGELELNLSALADNFKIKAKETMKSFEEFGSPWDDIFANFSKCQESTLQQLETRAIKCEVIHLDYQEKINTEIINLRKEETPQLLDKKLQQVFTILDKKIQKYNADFEEECKIITKCEEVIRKETVSAKNKIEKFLQKFSDIICKPPERAESKSSLYEDYNDYYCNLSLEELILHEMDQIEKQIDCLDNWKRGFLTNMVSYLNLFEKDIMEVVQTWVNQLINENTQYLEVNLKATEEWREDIKKDHDTRLRDIIDHQEQLERHKKFINGLINEAQECLDNFLDFSNIVKNYLSESSQTVEEYGSTIKNSGQIKCLQNMLRQLKDSFKSKIEHLNNYITERLTIKIFAMKSRNESFMDGVILFQDNGSYGNEEYNLAKKEITQLTKNVQKYEMDNLKKIKKTSNDAKSEIEKSEKSCFDSLNTTLQKLKMQEDVYNEINKCEFLIRTRMKQLADMISSLADAVMSFIDNCEKKMQLGEIISILRDLIRRVENTIEFLKGPFPNIHIPMDIERNLVEINVGKGKKSSKGQNTSKESKMPKEFSKPKDENDFENNNFAFIIYKLIQKTLTVVNGNGKNFYTILLRKPENPTFPEKNKDCEDCIHYSLQQLNLLQVSAFNCWAEESSKLINFFKSLEMPSIDYLLEENVSEESNDSDSTLYSNPNKLITAKIDKKFVEFQRVLEEMLNLLSSKNKIIQETENIKHTENSN